MTQLPSLERWALLPFLGFSYPNLLLVFLNLLLLGTCIICFSQVLDFLWVFFILFYFPVPYFGLACDHGRVTDLGEKSGMPDTEENMIVHHLTLLRSAAKA